MRLLISFLFVSCVFGASASNSDVAAIKTEATQAAIYPGPGKGGKAHKRINKKRKKACSNWARKSYAG